MGGASVNYLHTAGLVLAAYLAVFLESYVGGMRAWVGAQLDVLPVFMVYCGLSTGLFTLTLTAVLSALWFDTLSANPLGVSVLPYFLVAFITFKLRDVILREQPYARLILGMAASAVTPVLVLLILWGGGYRPIFGWGSLWQWIVVSVSGGLITPAFFWFFDRVSVALTYSRPSESTFRPDREIKRGRG
jgi:hypothetical protein